MAVRPTELLRIIPLESIESILSQSFDDFVCSYLTTHPQMAPRKFVELMRARIAEFTTPIRLGNVETATNYNLHRAKSFAEERFETMSWLLFDNHKFKGTFAPTGFSTR